VQRGDLASAATWIDSELPAATDEVFIKGPWDSVFTLSEDMSVGSIQLDTGNLTFDFREGNHTLTLTTPISPHGSETLFRYTQFDKNKNWTKLLGGIWECGNKNFDIVNLGFGGPYSFYLDNGCQLLNVKNSFLFRRISNSRVYVAGGSVITGNELNFGGDHVGTNDIISVSGGSKVNLIKNFVGQSSSEDFCSNLLEVKDEGSKLSCDFLYLGHNGYGGFGVRVDNKGEVNANYPVFCTNAKNCFIEVLDGAVFKTGCFDWYGSGCYTFVSDATLNVQWARFSLGGSNSGVIGSGNRLTLMGENAVFLNPMWGSDFLGSVSHDNVFELLDGVKVSPGKSMRLATSTNNIVRLSGAGTKFSLAGHNASDPRYLFEFGWTNAVGNTLEILNGARFEANGVWTYGERSKIVVSNATIAVGGYTVNNEGDYGFWLGKGAKAAGCSLVLKGMTPKLEFIAPNPDAELIHRMILTSGSVIRYEIPEQGYAPGYIPAELYGIHAPNGRLEIECSQWAAVNGLPPTELVLLRGAKNDELETFVATIESLPENVKCFVRGNDIVLRRRGSRLTSIIVR
jgi:hypothetical protein